MADARSFLEALKDLGPSSIAMILSVGGVGLALMILHFMAYKISAGSGIDVLTYFQPVADNWSIFAMVMIVASMMMVAMPGVAWLINAFRSGALRTK